MRNPWKLTSFALATMLAVTIGGGSLMSTASAEPQPVMREALEELRGAAHKLEVADRDKGGHRAKALELTKAAIVQVEEGIKFDNRH